MERKVLDVIKLTAKTMANAVKDQMESAKNNYAEGTINSLIATCLHEFYTTLDGTGMPEANLKASAASNAAKIAEQWIKAPTAEGRRNILALGMVDFFQQMGGEAVEVDTTKKPDTEKVVEKVNGKLKVGKQLTAEQKKARAEDRKKKLKQQEQEEDDKDEDEDDE